MSNGAVGCFCDFLNKMREAMSLASGRLCSFPHKIDDDGLMFKPEILAGSPKGTRSFLTPNLLNQGKETQKIYNSHTNNKLIL